MSIPRRGVTTGTGIGSWIRKVKTNLCIAFGYNGWSGKWCLTLEAYKAIHSVPKSIQESPIKYQRLGRNGRAWGWFTSKRKAQATHYGEEESN